MFRLHRKKIKKEEAKLIGIFLRELSEEYSQWEDFNEDYIVDKCLEYIRTRNLVFLGENITLLTEVGELNEAEKLLADYKKVLKETSGWINPFDPFEVSEIMMQEDDIVFQYPGALGDLIGPLLRGYFMAVLAPIKRGKTFWLIDLAMLAIMEHKKVVMFSFEMDKNRMGKRFYKNLGSISDYGGEILYPCFDCISNQDGTCEKTERENNIKLIEDCNCVDECECELPDFKEVPNYKICNYCKDNNLSDYIPSTWWQSIKRPSFNLSNVRDFIKPISKFYGNNFRFKAYPRFSAGMTEIENDLDILEYTEGFIPDIIITDMVDVMKKGGGEFRHEVDELWMHHARLASERHCLVVTATQAKAKSWRAKGVRADDSSENYRNPAHIDVMISLNQKSEEKERGRMRIGVVAHRDRDFNEDKWVTVLQQLNVGKPFLDSIKGEV